MLSGPNPRSARNARLVRHFFLTPVDLDDSVVNQALAKILVGRENPHLIDLIAKLASRGRQGVVRLVLAHRPDRHSDRANRVFRSVELRPQFGRNAFVAFVGRKQIVAKRANWIVERHRNMGDSFVRVMQQGQ